MWLQRVLVAVVLLPVGLLAMFSGEAYFAIMMSVFFMIATYEFIGISRIGGYHPADFALYGTVLLMPLGRTFWPQLDPLMTLVFFVLAAGIYHLVHFERGSNQTIANMAFTFTGMIYLGVLGSHFMAIRGLPGGEWWILVTLTSVWAADTGAYMIGKQIGKHPLAPRLSPKKTWEGYFGGLVTAGVLSPLLLMFYHQMGWPVPSEITIPRVVILGVVMGIFTVAGDLLISMLKRTYSLKDTGTILLGHGGVLDRIDSWLWAVSIGYYLITVIFLI